MTQDSAKPSAPLEMAAAHAPREPLRLAQLARRMLGLDLRLILRDRLLAGMAAYVFLIALVFRFGYPVVARLAMARAEVALSPWEPLITSYVAVNLSSLLVGVVFGFVLLEQVEERTVVALRTAPIRFDDFLVYRACAPIVFGFVFTPLVAGILGFSVPSAVPLLVISAVGAIQGGVLALFLPAFAKNRVQAFAISKIVSAVTLIPIVAFFLDEPLQFIAGIYPGYWAQKAWWAALEGDGFWVLYALAGALSTSLLLWVFLRRARKMMS